MENCLWENCSENIFTANYCRNHYQLKYRRGDFNLSNEKCLAEWCNNRARGKKGNSRLCNNCYVKTLRYKIDLDSFLSQKRECEICGSYKNLHIDHSHKTNKIRGMLCEKCNPALGMMDENIDLLEKMILYIKKYADLV